MRLRIQTFSPLPELKAWFIPEIQDAYETVFDLKSLLCKDIPQLRAKQIHAQYLILLLEGFELLNDSPISAVRDGDLIIVKAVKEYVDLSSELPSHSQKRKRNSNESDRPLKKISLQSAAIRQVFSTHKNVSPAESEESSSDSESNPSDSSSSTSSSSSSSTSSSEPSSKTPPVKNVAQLGKQKPAKEPFKQPPKTRNVPPGQGKSSTHARNQRRKKKREHEKLTTAAIQPKGVSNKHLDSTRTQNITDPSSVPLSASLPQSSNQVPTQAIGFIPHENHVVDQESSAPSSSSKYVHITADQVMMGSLRNKNKKKGFKQSMTGPIPRKIIFSGGVEQQQLNESNPVLDDDPPKALTDHQFSGADGSFRRLIPPSELQDLGQLPPNVFVTSVDVEKHIWGSHDGLPKNKRVNKRKRRNGNDDGGEYGFELGWEERAEQAYEEDLPYGDGAQAEGANLVASNGIDWNKAEKLWEVSSPIQDIQQLTDGIIFGWKELAINPQTFTPEMLLFLARVIAVTHEGTDRHVAEIRFRRLQRHWASEVAVAFGVASEEAGNGGDIMGEEECAPWSDVLKAHWRLIDM